MEGDAHQTALLQGQVTQLQQQLQHSHELLQQAQQLQDPAAVFQAHLAEDRRLKEREFVDNQIEKEVRRISNCDGTEPQLVKSWLKELDLFSPTQRTEVVTAPHTA